MGRLRLTLAPRAEDWILNLPPWASAMERTTVRPMPDPSDLVDVNGGGSVMS